MITVLFFAQAADATGRREVCLPLAQAGDAEALWATLARDYPALRPMRESVRLACNGEYLSKGTRFAAGDEVALIPPVSGG